MKRLTLIFTILILFTIPLTAAPDCLESCEWWAAGVAAGCYIGGGDAWTCYIAGELAGCQCRSKCDAVLPQCGSRLWMEAVWQRFQQRQMKMARDRQ